MGISFTVQCCRAAAFYSVKPAIQTPILKKMREVSGRVGYANLQIVSDIDPKSQRRLEWI